MATMKSPLVVLYIDKTGTRSLKDRECWAFSGVLVRNMLSAFTSPAFKCPMSSHSDRLRATFLKNSPGAPIIVISIYSEDRAERIKN